MEEHTTGVVCLAPIASEHLDYFKRTTHAYHGGDPKVATILRDLEIAVRIGETTQRILKENPLPHDTELCELHTNGAELIDSLGLQLRLIRLSVFCCAIEQYKFHVYLAKLRKDRRLDKMRADVRGCEKQIMGRIVTLLSEESRDTRNVRQLVNVDSGRQQLRRRESAESIRSLEERHDILEQALQKGDLSRELPARQHTKKGVFARGPSWFHSWLSREALSQQRDLAKMGQEKKSEYGEGDENGRPSTQVSRESFETDAKSIIREKRASRWRFGKNE
ncbi:hypothetical protein ACHAQA_008156 [Verticillium albo-atrum]